MKTTKNNIIAAVKEKTGFTVELLKLNGQYYWSGDVTGFFRSKCTNLTTLSHPNITVDSYLNDFDEKVKDAEMNHGEPLTQLLSKSRYSK